MEFTEEAAATVGFDLEEPPELRLKVASFLRGSMGTSKDEDDRMPLEPAVTEFSQWVPWRADNCKTPSWWAELLAVPGVEDHKKLAREVWASFWLLQRMRELRMEEADLQAPPVPPCLHWQKFMPPARSIYTSRDIREVPQEKAVAYARALQHWAERVDLPAGGRPCLLAESIKELRAEVKSYLSFSVEEVFQGVALPKKEDDQSLETMPANIPKTPCTPELATERRGPKFLGWEKILHPSQPVVTAGGDLPPIEDSEDKRSINSVPPGLDPSKPPVPQLETPTPPKPSLPVWALAVIQPMTPPCNFAGVTACLQTQEALETASKVPHSTLSIGVVVTLGISTISMSCIIKYEAMGVTYMDTVTTPLGGWTLVAETQKPHPRGPTIEDVTDCV